MRSIGSMRASAGSGIRIAPVELPGGLPVQYSTVSSLERLFVGRLACGAWLFAAGFAMAQAPQPDPPREPAPAATTAPRPAEDPDDDEPTPDETAEARARDREARRQRLEAMSAAARNIVWEAPEELKAIFAKHITLPEVETTEARARSIRPFLREVNRRVPEIAAAEGYFFAKVETRVEGEGEARKLVVSVTPGPRTIVDRVIVEFEGDVSGEGDGREAQRADVTQSWTLPAGRFFRQADWDDAKGRILEKLSERHYAAAKMADSVAIVDAESSKVLLKVILESGPRFTIGPMVVTGLKRYPESLVRRYYTQQPGDAYRQDKVSDFQRILQNTPFFASVVIDIERDPANPSNVPMQVTIVERAPVDIGLSLGYGTDTGVRGEVSYRHRNAFGSALDMQSALGLDRTRQIGYVDFFLPPLTLGGPLGDRIDTKDSFGVLFEHKSNQGLETNRVALAAYRQFKLRPQDDYRVGLVYQFERKQPDNADESIARALAPVGEATWRFVDAVLDPTKGGVLKVRIAAGGKAFLSTQDFVQTYAIYQHWFPLTANDQLLLRGEIGRTFAVSREGIPEDFLFRAGGSRSNRGYAFESLGARDGDAVVGGRYLLTGSVEYVHWFSKQWGGAVFTDIGDAGEEPTGLNANASYGLGARWRTPAGPLAFDLAYAENTRKWRVSFSVSVAF
ncbi:autotransporter assembly complex protein TamA [Usitatibacter palustris]|uniref:Outer membrane protein assembly factor BamA n=1 Tax=Usitatibacter palustris TaxID=2732487 RepID=A0A6M4HDX9_9PROT|nr:BamA/TamA family outer membrane protein [Usitatibacter palustris]QJR16814.1 Outer membrane protein assembly factor BamA [Usitatibacter palustris]